MNQSRGFPLWKTTLRRNEVFEFEKGTIGVWKYELIVDLDKEVWSNWKKTPIETKFNNYIETSPFRASFLQM
jgi:hypothetical protein